MPEQTSLLANLVPKLTNRAEDTATDALAFLLNNSQECRDALDHLLRRDDLDLEPIVRFETQVTYKDGSRPDMNGFDENGKKRLLVESKFWHSLTHGQASGYLDQLDEDGPGVLMFIVPASRVGILWREIANQMQQEKMQVADIATSDWEHRGQIEGSEKRIVLVSWDKLIGILALAAPPNSQIAADIQQLKSFVTQGAMGEFHPIHKEQLSPEFARLVVSLVSIIDDARTRGSAERWLFPDGNRWNRNRDGNGSGWYLRIFSKNPSYGGWFGVYYELWARGDCDDTPLWLMLRNLELATLHRMGRRLNLKLTDERYFPISLRTQTSRDKVLDDVVAQLRRISEAIKDTG